jgi:hypothetical protein
MIYNHGNMSEYGRYKPPHKTPPLISEDVLKSKAERRKIIEKAEETRRKNYIAFFKKRLQERRDLDTIA